MGIQWKGSPATMATGLRRKSASVNIEFGIVGLPQSGRTTVFNALTGGAADTEKHSREGAAHVGVATVSDPRLEVLAGILHPERTVPVSISYVDIGASVKGLVEDKGIGGQLLGQLSKVDALINVVRGFEDPGIPLVEGNLDVDRDITTMNLELAFSDLAIIERRLARIEASLKAARPTERQAFAREQDLLDRIRQGLERDIPVREQDLTADETRLIGNFQFLTAKPLLIVSNIGEEKLPEAASLEEGLNSRYARPGCRAIALCGKLEMELTQLDQGTRESYRSEFGLTESGQDRLVRLSYEVLGLVTFFSMASNEVRAWPVRRGTDARTAAGKIHTDMERGFIRAEVIGYDDLAACGSVAEARKRGLLRLEGKTYQIQDGDIITFMFNV